MAERRMFAKSVTNSARFLRMPQTSRLLYYDLGMTADDDGVVEAYTVLKTTGAAEDDLRILAAKGFIKILNDDLVCVIVEWNLNNYIRADRHRPSIYRDLLPQYSGKETMEKKCLSSGPDMETECLSADTGLEAERQPSDCQETDCPPSDCQWETDCPSTDANWDTQVRLGKDRIGKDRLDKDRKGERRKEKKNLADKPPAHARFIFPDLKEIQEYCQERHNNVNPKRFFDYYQANGWRVGKNPMIDWKAAVRSWEENGYDAKKQQEPDLPSLAMMGVVSV